MKTYALVGFASPLAGYEQRLTRVDPIISVSGREYVVVGDDWANGMRRAQPSIDKSGTTRFVSPAAHTISEGQSVWVAGPELQRDLRSSIEAARMLHFSAWKRLPPTHAKSEGFRWFIADSAVVADRRIRAASRLGEELLAALKSSSSEAAHDAHALFRLYREVGRVNATSKERGATYFTTLALCFRLQEEPHKARNMARRAEAAGVVDADEDVDDAASVLEVRLLRERIAELQSKMARLEGQQRTRSGKASRGAKSSPSSGLTIHTFTPGGLHAALSPAAKELSSLPRGKPTAVRPVFERTPRGNTTNKDWVIFTSGWNVSVVNLSTKYGGRHD